MNLLDFNALVQRFAAGARAATTTALDFTVGAVFRAIAEASAGLAIWLQWLILDVLRQTRAATSRGSELDTWVGDFGLTRLPAIGSVGQVSFSRNSAAISALVPVGAVVKTIDGAQSFAVALDLGNAAYDAALGGYLLASGTPSASLPVQALTAGAASNVQAGTIAVLASAIPAIDTVTNQLAFAGGMDAESDAALRARFALYVQGFSKATLAAIGSAIANVQQGLTYAVAQNVDTLGGYRPGNLVVTIDDGTGAPSSTLQSTVYAAIDAVRSAGETFSVHAPTVSAVAVSMTITAAPGYAKASLQGPVAAVVTAYLDGLGIGAPLLYGQVYRTAYDAAPGIATITGLTLNGAQADITVGVSGVIRAGSVAVN